MGINMFHSYYVDELNTMFETVDEWRDLKERVKSLLNRYSYVWDPIFSLTVKQRKNQTKKKPNKSNDNIRCEAFKVHLDNEVTLVDRWSTKPCPKFPLVTVFK